MVDGVPVQLLLAAAPNPAVVGQQIRFIFIIANTPAAPATAPQPTGTLTLAEGTTSFGSTTLSTSTTGGSFSAFHSFTTPGAHTIQLSYGGDSTHAPATVSVVVNINDVPVPPPAPGSFTLSVSPATLTVRGGTTATVDVQATSMAGYTGSLALTTGTLPAGVSARFNPASLSLGAGAAVHSTLAIATPTVPPYTLARSQTPGTSRTVPLILAATMLPLLLYGRRRLPRLPTLLIAILSFSSLVVLTGCGPDVVRRINPTPTSTYTIPVTATDPATGVALTVNVTLTITP
jgi:hypothetical protein